MPLDPFFTGEGTVAPYRNAPDGMACGPTASGVSCAYVNLPPLAPGEVEPPRRRTPDLEALVAEAFDRAIARAPAPEFRTAPPRRGITGLESYFWLVRPLPVVTALAQVPRLVVEARAEPVRYGWEYGDGGRTVTTYPGRPYARGRPGNIAHTYETRARYTVTATAIWRARWRIGDGAWRPLGFFSTSAARRYRVSEIVPVLVPVR